MWFNTLPHMGNSGVCWTFHLCCHCSHWSRHLMVIVVASVFCTSFNPLLRGRVVIQSLSSHCTCYNLYYSSHWYLLQTQDCVSRVTSVCCRSYTSCRGSHQFLLHTLYLSSWQSLRSSTKCILHALAHRSNQCLLQSCSTSWHHQTIL